MGMVLVVASILTDSAIDLHRIRGSRREFSTGLVPIGMNRVHPFSAWISFAIPGALARAAWIEVLLRSDHENGSIGAQSRP